MVTVGSLLLGTVLTGPAAPVAPSLDLSDPYETVTVQRPAAVEAAARAAASAPASPDLRDPFAETPPAVKSVRRSAPRSSSARADLRDPFAETAPAAARSGAVPPDPDAELRRPFTRATDERPQLPAARPRRPAPAELRDPFG